MICVELEWQDGRLGRHHGLHLETVEVLDLEAVPCAWTEPALQRVAAGVHAAVRGRLFSHEIEVDVNAAGEGVVVVGTVRVVGSFRWRPA